jgi:RNA polymerase sigma-70 factor, ECF subfamily
MADVLDVPIALRGSNRGTLARGVPRSTLNATAPPDAALLHGILRGDEASLRTLYGRYSGLMYALALRILGDRDLAEEVVQDVFLKCWNRSHTYDAERGSVAGWLMGITRNRAISLLRGRQHHARLRERSLPETETAGSPEQADECQALALQLSVRAAVDSLSTAHQQVIRMAYYGGCTQSEIAAALGEPLGTIKTRMRAAMERLRRSLCCLNGPEQGHREDGHT